MKNAPSLRKSVSAVMTAAAAGAIGLLPGCWDDDSGRPKLTYTGTATAPNALLVASPGVLERIESFFITRAVADVSGTSPLIDATVELVRVDDAGAQLSVVETTTTGDEGEFTFRSTARPDANYIIRVSSGGVVLRAPLYARVVDVSAASEAVVQQLLATGDPLANFSVDELSSIIEYVESGAVSFDSLSDVDDALSVAQAALPLLEDLADDFSSADAPVALAGTFHFTELALGIDVDADIATQDGFGNESNFVEVRAAGSLGTATVKGAAMSMTATEQHGAANLLFVLQNNVLQSLTVSGDTGPTAVDGAGTFTTGTNGTLMLATDTGTFAGQTDEGRQVFVLSTVEDRDNIAYGEQTADTSWRGLALGVKRSTSAPSVSGSYHLANLEYGAESAGGNVASLRGGGQLFTLAFSGGNATGTAEHDSMELSVAFADDLLTTDSGTDTLAGATYTVATTGAVSLNVGDEVLDGAASPDGDMLFLRGNYGTSQELVLGVKQGSAMSRSIFAGTWRMVGIGSGLGDGTDGAINGNVRASAALYDVTFYCDGSMQGITGNNRQAGVQFAAGNPWRSLEAEAAAGQVLTVIWNGANDGRFSLDDPSSDVLEGAVSAGGDYFVLSTRGGEANQGWRELFFAVRKSGTCVNSP